MNHSGSTNGQERHLQFVAKRYPAWYVELCAPVTLALAACSWPQAEHGMARAEAAKPGLDDNAQAMLELVLATQRFFLALYRDGADTALKLWPELRRRLSASGGSPALATMRQRQYIIHRCMADTLGWEALPLPELQGLLRQLPLAECSQYLWHKVAKLAYLQGWEDVLRLAYSELSLCNDGLMSGWFFNHTRLMLLLRTGEARQQDAGATLACAQFATQVPDIRDTVLPALQERGWLSPTKLDALERRLTLNPPVINAGLIE